MTTARYLVGDVHERLAEIPDGSIDLVLTSPPFLALRSYLPADHPDKGKEIGSEPTPAAYLDTLLQLTAEWGRVLAPHGSICVELGDTYAGSGGAGGDYNALGMRADQPLFRQTRNGRDADAWPLDKSLCGIPDAYALSLEYGWNVLRRNAPDSPAGRWRARNKVAWVRPNPPVGALGDKFRPATSYLTIACRARDRYFDLDAVRTQPKPHTLKYPRDAERYGINPITGARGDDGKPRATTDDPAGAPPLDWWNIPPTGYPGAHYAVYPPELCTRPILTMTPRRVCTTCGEPSRRIVGEAEYERPNGDRGPAVKWASSVADGRGAHTSKPDGQRTRVAPTLGWSDCGCSVTAGPLGASDERDGGLPAATHPPTSKWRPGHVLDPFAGTGTTLAVATGHGREATGIDLDPRNADLAQQRVGMFLTIDHGTQQETA